MSNIEPEDNMLRIIRENREFRDWFFRLWTQALILTVTLCIGIVGGAFLKSPFASQNTSGLPRLVMANPPLTNHSVRMDQLLTNLQAVAAMAEMIATNKPTMSERIEHLSNAQFGTGLFVGFRCKELGGTKEDLMQFLHYKRSNRLDLCEQWFKER